VRNSLFKISFIFLTLWSAMVRAEDAVVTYPANGSFEDVLQALKMAVTNRGLLVSGTLHVQDMLARTGKDLGFPDPTYLKAESVEFCSAQMSHRMIAADPRNLVICPFTIAVYVRADEPDQVYLGYRQIYLAGDADEETKAVLELVDDIAQEASEGF
jgi:uncharacterized protein (DUF302 family)